MIKVEPLGGDDTHHWPPFRDGTGTIFLSVNRNKKSIAVDLKRPEGLARRHRLCAQSDVVVEIFGPGAADRLGVDWDALRATNPRLVYASISGHCRRITGGGFLTALASRYTAGRIVAVTVGVMVATMS